MTITNAREAAFPIGELSRRTGVKIETIRFYERIKMLAPPVRTESGRRVYQPNDGRVLAFIRRGRELGFSLDEIRTLLGLRAPANVSCLEVKEIARKHIADVQAKISDLSKLEQILSDTVAQCTGDIAPVCPVLDLLDDA